MHRMCVASTRDASARTSPLLDRIELLRREHFHSCRRMQEELAETRGVNSCNFIFFSTTLVDSYIGAIVHILRGRIVHVFMFMCSYSWGWGRSLLERLASQDFCISKLLRLKTFTFFLFKLTCNYDSCILHSFLLFASRMHLACSPSLHTQRPQQLLIAIAVVVVLSDLLFLLCFLSSNVLRKPFGIRALAPHKTRISSL